MRRWHAFLIGLLAAACPGAGDPKGDEAGFTPLFDGETLAGWRQVTGDPKMWAVEDGVLVSVDRGGGWIGTERPYADFELRLEFRLTPGSNSGVYLRAPTEMGRMSRLGLEIQLLDEPTHPNIKPYQRTGAIYHVAPPQAGHLKPAGEWNTMEIRAEGPRVVVRLNGAQVVDDRLDAHPDLEAEHPGLRRKDGLIGLQSHNGRVEFRDLRIKELPGPR